MRISRRGRKFQQVYGVFFIFNSHVTIPRWANPERGSTEGRQQQWNHDQIALRVPPAFQELHFPMMYCRGRRGTRCGEERSVCDAQLIQRKITRFCTASLQASYVFAEMLCMRGPHRCSSCRALSHDTLPLRSSPSLREALGLERDRLRTGCEQQSQPQQVGCIRTSLLAMMCASRHWETRCRG
jgi:hypothetical protein